MRNLVLVARREYLEQIRGRAFKVTTILVPALFGVVIFIMYMAGRGATGAKHIVIASNDVALAADVRDQLAAHNEAKSEFEVQAPAASGDRAGLVDKVRTKAIDGFLWVDAPAGGVPKAVYESQSSGDFITDARLGSALNHALMRRRLASTGIPAGNIESMLKDVDV